MAFTGFEFTADFPDDGLWEGDDDDGEIVRPSGMAMAIAIVGLLRSTGIPVTDPEPDIDHYCWMFATQKGGKLFWIRAYDLGEDERFVMVKGTSPWFKRLFNRQDAYLELLRTFCGLLCEDPRFGSVQWVDLNRRPISPR